MSQSNNSLIFIPDITGFTRFVNETEVSHSQHIISELLEIIINSNTLKMKVSEVEGDAILFYKLNEVPSTHELLKQAELMFLNFHNHLKEYEVRRICKCGACSGASGLSLKVIVHQGEIGFTNVNNVSKPFGKELVLSHRLLKNEVGATEYMLLSAPFHDALKEDAEELPSWAEIHSATSNYPNIGDVSYDYIPLHKLKEKLSQPKPVPPPKQRVNPFRYQLLIECAPSKVYSVLISLELRQLWNNVEEVIFEKDRVNRVGTRHQCLFPVGNAEFETFTDDFGADKMVYGEQILNAPFMKSVNVYYVLSKNNGGTLLTIELHFFPSPFLGLLMYPIMKSKMFKGIKQGAATLKSFCESESLKTD